MLTLGVHSTRCFLDSSFVSLFLVAMYPNGAKGNSTFVEVSRFCFAELSLAKVDGASTLERLAVPSAGKHPSMMNVYYANALKSLRKCFFLEGETKRLCLQKEAGWLVRRVKTYVSSMEQEFPVIVCFQICKRHLRNVHRIQVKRGRKTHHDMDSSLDPVGFQRDRHCNISLKYGTRSLVGSIIKLLKNGKWDNEAVS